MTDPFINVLFDTRHQDTNVSNVEHGKRLGGFFLDFFGGDTTYCKLRGLSRIGEAPGGILNRTHVKAKACPMRAKQH